jgi:TRAP-type C4-dicarboxylate transport system permease small subunit
MSSSFLDIVQRLRRICTVCEDSLLALMLLTMIGLGTLQIVQRNFFGSSFVWSDELLRLLVLWVAMAGAVAASRDDRHIVIDLLSKFLSEKHALSVRTLIDLFTVAVCALLAWHTFRFVYGEWEYGATLFDGVPAWPFESIIPIAFVTITYRYTLFFCLHGRKAVALWRAA